MNGYSFALGAIVLDMISALPVRRLKRAQEGVAD
jgi:hypothetical protein